MQLSHQCWTRFKRLQNGTRRRSNQLSIYSNGRIQSQRKKPSTITSQSMYIFTCMIFLKFIISVFQRASIPDQKCNKNWEAPVSDNMQLSLKKQFSMDANMYTIRYIMDNQTYLMKEYVGLCKKADGWKNKYHNIIQQLKENHK